MRILFFVLLSLNAFGQDYASIAKAAAQETDRKLGIACNCNFTVAGDQVLDGVKMGVKPGQTVCFKPGTYSWLYIQNFKGAPGQPITFINECSGKVIFNGGTGGSRVIWAINDQYVRFTGSGNPAIQYGIEITGGGQGIDFRDRSSDIEFDHVYGHDIGYSFFNAKTDPVCAKPETQRGGFTLYNVSFHDNLAENIKTGEAAYIGESHYSTGVKAACGIIYEHDVIGVKFINNIFRNIGRDAIQIGSCIRDCTISGNTIFNYGMTKEYGQGSGVTINPGTVADVFDNVIDTGSGYGVIAQGPGGSKIYNNMITNTGWPGDGGGIMLAVYGTSVGKYQVYNNTLKAVNRYGIEYYCEADIMNNVIGMAVGDPIKASAPVKINDFNNLKTTGAVTVSIPAGVGYNAIKKETGIVQIETSSSGTVEVYVVSESGKRIKIK